VAPYFGFAALRRGGELVPAGMNSPEFKLRFRLSS